MQTPPDIKPSQLETQEVIKYHEQCQKALLQKAEEHKKRAEEWQATLPATMAISGSRM